LSGCSPIDLVRSGFVRVKVKVTRVSRYSDRERYLIYLPEDYNDIWRVLHEKGEKVEVYIKLPLGELGE